MIDRAIGVAGIGIGLISGLLLVVFPNLDRKIGIAGLALGVLLVLIAGGIALLPDGNAQAPSAVNQGPGSAYSYGQQGGVTAGTINIAPGRLAFTEQLGNELLSKMPVKKPVRIQSVGGNADQLIANEIQVFLQQQGYSVQRTMIGMMAPPPDRPITLTESPDSYSLTIAPSAH